ncbi:T9SS type B sorting domain-containing protein [Paucihalobacter sp.]|uniref:T9SS type B sorting domain-containing protein n=2 Tax=Paucihalobacter sp. TaxID=2850405 RepID=UPI002FE0B55F
MQNGTFNQCSGVFYDTGGEFGGYSSNEDITTTICADVAGDFVRVDFTSFTTQLNQDILSIYDGADITAPLIGNFSGVNNPGLVTATAANTSGCLTFRFVSNATGVAAGWAAEIECATPCQNITATIDSTNPPDVAGIIEVDPGDVINFEGSATFSVDGSSATYEWDFNNGDFLTGTNVNYAFSIPGLYTVTFEVTDDNPLGCSGTATIQVRVRDNDTCAGQLPICSGIENVPAPTGSGQAEAGINYGCLGSQPRPRWYFLQIGDTTGNLSFTLTQTTGQNQTGTGIDVDFIIWGPFSQPECGAANLNSTTQVDCSFSASATETITINNAPANSFYTLLITNFNGAAGFINLELNPGSTADTNCDIICQVELGPDQDLCAGEDFLITPTFNGSFNSFEWRRNDVVIPGATSPNLLVTESGTYTLLVDGLDAVFGDPCSTQDEIVINIAPEVALNDTSLSACSGSATGVFDLENANVDLVNPDDPADFTFLYFNSQNDADNNTNAIAAPDNYTGSDAEIIYVRVIANGSNCFNVGTITLNVSGQPAINSVSDLELCDDDSNNGIESFDLEQQTTFVLGAQSETDFEVTYHTSFADADAGINSLTTPYDNTVNPQPIFVRVESIADATCFAASPDPLFNLVVNPRTIVNTPSNLELCDDASNDGFETFDLSLQNAEILDGRDPNENIVTFHETQQDANDGSNPLPTTYTNTIASNQTIFVRLENTTFPDCFGTTFFDLIVNPLPNAILPTPLEVCDDATPDGFAPFNLTDKNVEIINGQPNVVVNYFETLADADNNVNPLADGYVNTAAFNHDVFVRLENTITSCFAITTLNLTVTANPEANSLSDLEVCDDDNDGFAQFDLSLRDSQLIGLQTDVVVTYHETQSDANTGVNILPTLYNNIVPSTQTIFARIESTTAGCYDTTPLNLIVNSIPVFTTITRYELCDDNNPGDATETFDLSTKDAEVINGQTNIAVSYYATQGDAETGTNALPTLYSNTSNPQIIYTALVNTNTGCSAVGNFTIELNPLPQITAPTALEVCDDNVPDGFTQIDLSVKDAEITGGNPNYTINYYETQADADNQQNPLPVTYTNTSNPQTIYAGVTDNNTGCLNTTTLALVVEQAPIANMPSPLEFCDPDNDGFGVFTLTDADAEITSGVAGLTVSYHETQSDADNNNNPLTSPYNNIVANLQTVYARVESTTVATDCATIVELQLIVQPTPVVPQVIDDYVLCDTNQDGFTQFNLNTKAAEILNGQDPTDYTLTYHLTQGEAESSTNPILNTGSYTNTSNPQTIYVSLQGSNGCISIGSFTIRVDLPPIAIQPTPLALCDDTIADERTEFDLTVKDTEITGGNPSWTVNYYETQIDAENDTNVIANPSQYTNTSVGGNAANPQTLFVRVTDTNTGCIDLVTLTIRVLPNPTPSLNPEDLILCDDTNVGDGVEEFDLTQNETFILNGEAGVTPSYHISEEDAQLGENAIANPSQYTNQTSPAQTIYVRVTNDVTGCYTIVDFNLIVNPLPAVVAVTDIIICELNTDGFFTFDFTAKDAEVLNGQDSSIFEVAYYETQVDADNQQNPIVGNYTNTTNPQRIYVSITNTVTDCSISTQSFNVEVQESAQANSDGIPIIYEQCDDNVETDGDPSNDSVQFDLSTQDAQVLDGQDPSNYTVSYYQNEIDAELGVNPLPTLYENLSNPQVIYVRVDNDTTVNNICYAVAELTLQVNPLPIVNLEERYTLCLDTNGTEVVNPPIIDTGLSETDYSFEWSLDGVVLAGETGASLIPSQGGSYTVIVTDISTSVQTACSTTASTEVIESAPPSLTVSLSTAFAGTNTIEALAEGVGDYEYNIDNGPWQDSGTFTNVSIGDHIITARDKTGCGITSVSITVLDYPLYFTPNGDGYNDTWNIIGLNDQPSAKIYIFDRYGKLLKQLSPIGSGWNGTYNGSLMPSSDYWFVVEYTEPSTGEQKEFKAHFTLKR